MTPAECIVSLRKKCWHAYYKHKDVKSYCQQSAEIHKVLAWYGAECAQRGFDIPMAEIHHELSQVIERITAADVQSYFPAYLRAAVTGHLNRRAEEYSSRKRTAENIVARVMGGVKVNGPVPRAKEITDAEQLQRIHDSIKIVRKRKTKDDKQQMTFL